MISRDKVKLAVLNSDVPDIERCWRIYNRCRNERDIPYFLDYSDDTEIIIDGPSYGFHEHVSPLSLMTPRFPIPEDIKREMETWVERAEKEDEVQQEHQSTGRWDQRGNKVEYMGDFYQLSLYLYFPESADSPLLLITDNYGNRVSLCVDRANYADYEDYTDRLTDAQLKSLQDYLEDVEVGKTKWWYMLRKWNEDEDHKAISLNTPLPDYTTLINQIFKYDN